MDLVNIIVAALGGGLIGALATFVVAWRRLPSELRVSDQTAEKIDADTASVIGQAYRELLDQQAKAYEDRLEAKGELIEALGARIAALERDGESREKERLVEQTINDKRIHDLEEELDELRTWIEKKGLTPPPRRKRTPTGELKGK